MTFRVGAISFARYQQVEPLVPGITTSVSSTSIPDVHEDLQSSSADFALMTW